MRILVTGAVGFIGRHVVKALLEKDHDVVTLDCIGDVDVLADITQPLQPIPHLDAVIHLAAVANPRECDANPAKAFDVNVNGTHQVLKMALASGAKKFIFSSSAHVYDIPPKYLPTDEVHPLRLNNTYTTSKILGEQLCELFWTNHGLSYTVLRLYNAYGPGQALGYFIPDVTERARNGGLDLTGSNVTKDWVHVADVASAFVTAIETPFVGVINIGTGIETSLEVIGKEIARLLGVQFTSKPAAKATRMCADNDRARRVLSWEPTISIMDGIRGIIGHGELSGAASAIHYGGEG